VTLAQLEGQLKTTMEQLDETESRLAASAEENYVLLNEMQRLGSKNALDTKVRQEERARNANVGPHEERAALFQSQQDIAHLLIIVEEKNAKNVTLSEEYYQACAFADSVKGEIKRLEGLLDTLQKRQVI